MLSTWSTLVQQWAVLWPGGLSLRKTISPLFGCYAGLSLDVMLDEANIAGTKEHRLHFGRLLAGSKSQQDSLTECPKSSDNSFKTISEQIIAECRINQSVTESYCRLLDIVPDQFGVWHQEGGEHSRSERAFENIFDQSEQVFEEKLCRIPGTSDDTAIMSAVKDCNLNKPCKD